MRIGIVGGTGREGRGLALRWSAKGHTIVLGSRDAARAKEKAAEFFADASGQKGPIEGATNEEAAGAEVVLLTVPYAAHADTLKGLKAALAGRVLIDITVPLQPPKVTQVHLPPGTSAALEAQSLLDPSTRVVATLHHISSAHLGDAAHRLAHDGATGRASAPSAPSPIDSDVLVCSDDQEARALAIGLVEDLGLRGLDAGPLRNAVALESLTPVLLHLNRKYKTNTGIRITGIADKPAS